jgi:Protein ENHANCED DISEASE RESISTANCE 2, C-terminal
MIVFDIIYLFSRIFFFSYFNVCFTSVAMVVVIVNLCVIMFNCSSSSYMSLLYLVVCNCVVIKTLLMSMDRVINSAVAKPDESGAVVELITVGGDTPNDIKTAPSEHNLEMIEAKVGSSGKPIAGSTFPYFEGVSPNVDCHTWSKCDHRKFKVRVGPNYNRNKQKAPSAQPLFEVFAQDVFCTSKRIDHVTQKIELPDTSDLNLPANCKVPPIFVVQLQLPSDPPEVKLFGPPIEDGAGWAIVLYFKMTQDTCNQLANLETASPAVKLFSNWCENCDTDPACRARFKIIASCLNLEELGMSQTVTAFNAKPVLIRRTSTIYKTPSYVETCIHVFKFDYIAKSSIHFVTSRCGLMFMEVGFVIEGREDSELPETLIGCTAINRPQEKEADFLFG